MAHTYILYSKELDRYYIGHTEQSAEERLKKHLSGHGGYTGKAKDWEIKWYGTYETKEAAYVMERKIKSWKSRSAIEKLIGGG